MEKNYILQVLVKNGLSATHNDIVLRELINNKKLDVNKPIYFVKDIYYPCLTNDITKARRYSKRSTASNNKRIINQNRNPYMFSWTHGLKGKIIECVTMVRPLKAVE